MKEVTLSVKGLINILESFPSDTPVFYEDENFGGKSEVFTGLDIKLENGMVLIRTPYWDAVS